MSDDQEQMMALEKISSAAITEFYEQPAVLVNNFVVASDDEEDTNMLRLGFCEVYKGSPIQHRGAVAMTFATASRLYGILGRTLAEFHKHSPQGE